MNIVVIGHVDSGERCSSLMAELQRSRRSCTQLLRMRFLHPQAEHFLFAPYRQVDDDRPSDLQAGWHRQACHR